jgi:hypothetical protein
MGKEREKDKEIDFVDKLICAIISILCNSGDSKKKHT